MATATLLTPEVDDEIQRLFSAETESTALVLQGVVSLDKIADAAMYVRVAAAGMDAATNIKSITAILEPICKARFQRHKRATQLLAQKIEPFEAVKRKASQLIGVFDQEQERLRREEEARLQREAEQEARRLEKEQSELADAEARLYVPPVYTPPVILQKSVPNVAGKISFTTYDWRVKQSAKCHSPAHHKPEECSICLEEVPRQYLVLNTKLIGQLVRATKEKTSISGIEVFPASGAWFKG